MKDTACFEFGKRENMVLSELSRNLHKLGIIVLIGGLLFAAYLLVSFLDPMAVVVVSNSKGAVLSAVDYALWMLIALLLIYLSLMVVRLAKPIRLITETTGADISHLMEFAKDLTRMSRVSIWGVSTICSLVLVSLALLVLVF